MKNRLKKFCYWTLLLVLGFIAGIVLMMMFETAVRADRPPPQYTCSTYIYPRIKCEAQYVDPFVPEWSVYLNGKLVEYDDGIVVYLTIADEWERIDVCVANNCTGILVRWLDGVTHFKPVGGEQ